MRIAILTLPPHTNYGGILQAYALEKTLESMGNEVDVLAAPKHIIRLPWWRHILSISKRVFLKYILGKKDIWIDRVKGEQKKSELSMANTKKFVSNYIHIRVVGNLDEIKPDDYGAIIVGSDQIWRQTYNQIWNGQRIDDVYLGFTRGWNINRIAFAASFGKDEIEIKDEIDLRKCREAISQFDAVSTREESGVKICSEVLGYKNAKWMPDPTLLLSKDDYESLIPNFNKQATKQQLLSYMLDDNAEKSALRSRIAKEKNLIVNITNKVDYWKEGEEIIPQPPVEEWLRAFAESEYVITDSFHACVFSIIFHRQFTVLANKDRGIARFTSLLSMFGLGDRMIYSPSEYKVLPDIDYAKVDELLKERRKDAKNFLLTNIQIQ